MNLHYRLESAGRTRFLLALSLSTLTALGVAAPLAMQAMRADEATFASGDAAAAPADVDPEDVKAEVALNRSLTESTTGQRGGIEASEDTSKATGRTTKAESVEPVAPAEEPAPEGVLTNAEPEPAETDPAESDPVETPDPDPAAQPSTTVPTTPVDPSVSTTDTTDESGTSTTETTVEDTSTSSTETTTTTSTSTTSSSETAVPVPEG